MFYYKHMQVSLEEINAAKADYCKKSSRKYTLHYDTTQQSSIAGEWQSLILVFSDGSEYGLYPLFFAYEDSQQITNLIVETYKILGAAVTVTCNSDVAAALL